MSVLGQTRRFGRLPMTSGLPPSTDIFGARRHVSKVPTSDIVLWFGMKEAANCDGLDRRDKTLDAPALRAFVDVMYETRLFFLDTRKPHLPLAFEAERLLRERLRRGLRFDAEILADSLGTHDPPGCPQPGFSFVRPWLETEKGTELFDSRTS
jgi:hypothetical protein